MEYSITGLRALATASQQDLDAFGFEVLQVGGRGKTHGAQSLASGIAATRNKSFRSGTEGMMARSILKLGSVAVTGASEYSSE